MRRRSIAALATVTATVAAASITGATVASAAPSAATSAIPNTAPSWTAHATRLGNARARKPVAARVYLQPRGGFAALSRTVAAISTPGSADFHHFLTARQYRARFTPTATTVASVRSYLTHAGLHVTGVGASNRYVSVRGTAAAAQEAFHTTLGTYRRGKAVVNAPASVVALPTSVARAVLTVTGLDTSSHTVTPATKQQVTQPAGFRNARPCSKYFGQIAASYQQNYKTPLPKFQGATLSYAPCGYTGPQLRAAYEGIYNKLDGAGVSVGITDAYASPTIFSDADTYAATNGDGSYARGQFRQTQPSLPYRRQDKCGPTGWYGEETLDVEAVHAMAPGANIHYYASRSCYDDDFLDTLGTVVDDDAVSVVSNSWADVEAAESAASIREYQTIFMQGAAEGIAFTYSSGDDGDELAKTALKQVDYPASDPYVTGVGGTSTAIGPAGGLQFQTGWGTENYSLSGNAWSPSGFLYGAGGGVSTLFNRPAYQAGTNPSPYRAVPDVAMDADPQTGMLIGETQTFPNGTYYDQYRIGGTSLASPLFAGMTALSIEKAKSAPGLLNPIIYANRSAFLDVKPLSKPAGVVRVNFVNGVNAGDGYSYFVRTFDQDSSLATTKGYDQVTGVGVPGKAWLTTLPTTK